MSKPKYTPEEIEEANYEFWLLRAPKVIKRRLWVWRCEKYHGASTNVIVKPDVYEYTCRKCGHWHVGKRKPT